MVQAVAQWVGFQEFLAWKPETGRYELHDGVIVEMQPSGPHEQVVGLLNRKLNVLIDQEALDYFYFKPASKQTQARTNASIQSWSESDRVGGGGS